MTFRSSSGLRLMALIASLLLVTPALAVFSVTNCSDTISTGVPEIECKALEALALLPDCRASLSLPMGLFDCRNKFNHGTDLLSLFW